MQDKFFTELSKFKTIEKVELGTFDDIQNTVSYANRTIETADKVLVAAKKVNKVINSVTDDVRFYNKYRDLVKDDLSNFLRLLEKQLNDAEKQAKELGVDLKLASPNYERGKLGLKDIKDVIRELNNNTLEFDI